MKKITGAFLEEVSVPSRGLCFQSVTAGGIINLTTQVRFRPLSGIVFSIYF